MAPFLAAAAWTCGIVAQISVGPNVHVSASRGGDAHYEVIAAADPTRPERLVVGEIERHGTSAGTIVYASTDGGESWSATLETPPAAHRSDATSDPAVAYGPDGTAYFLSSLLPPNSSGPQRHMLLYRSKDGGTTWLEPVTFTYSDREYIAVDGGHGGRRGRIYVNGNGRSGPYAGSLTVFTSADDGASFHEAVMPGLPTAPVMGNIVVLSDGTPIALLTRGASDHPPAGVSETWLQVSRSMDGGGTFSPPENAVRATLVAGRKGAHNNTLALPLMAVDASTGKYRDRLYIVWPEFKDGHTDIYLVASADAGHTWTAPTRVNDAPPASPPVDHFMATVAVNKDGVVGVLWYDRRARPDNIGWDVRFSASTDGGATFLPSVKVSERGTSCGASERWIIDPRVTRTDGSIALDMSLNTFTFLGGDTAGLVADARGRVHAFWIENSTGIPQVWTAPIDLVEPSAPAVPAERARGNLTAQVTVETDEPAYDAAARTLTIRVRVLNSGSAVIQGPLTLRASSVQSEIATVAFANSDRGGTANGAEFDVGAAGQMLRPGERTPYRTIVIKMADVRPFRDGDFYRRGLAKVSFTVWGGGE